MATDKHGKFLGVSGDVHFIDHGGGPIFQLPSGDYEWHYVQHKYWNPRDPKPYTVYEVWLNPQVLSDRRLREAAGTVGETEASLRAAIKTGDPFEYARVAEALIAYSGVENAFNPPERDMTRKEVEREYGRYEGAGLAARRGPFSDRSRARKGNVSKRRTSRRSSRRSRPRR